MSGTGPAGRLSSTLRDLTPGYFALVMASGIISVGMRQHDRLVVSVALLVVCAVSFAVLVVLNVWRLVAHRDAVVADFTDPARGFGFFTLLAGGSVLGVRLAVDGHHGIALALLAVGLLAWLLLGYVIPWTAVLGRAEHPPLSKANGTWFIWVVAAQSVATSAATLQPVLVELRDALGIVAVFSWSVGMCLYAAVGVMVSLRLLLYDPRPTDLSPPYWVAMGACAITVLAGARVVELAGTPMVDAARGLVAGVSLAIWAFGTRLIPALADPRTRGRRLVAAPHPPGAAALRAVAVEHGLPDGHVRRRVGLAERGRPPAARRRRGRRRHLVRLRGLVPGAGRDARRSGYELRDADRHDLAVLRRLGSAPAP